MSDMAMSQQLAGRKPKMDIHQLSVGFFPTWEVVADYTPGEDNQTCNPGNKHDR
jgi:hypothetical protein